MPTKILDARGKYMVLQVRHSAVHPTAYLQGDRNVLERVVSPQLIRTKTGNRAFSTCWLDEVRSSGYRKDHGGISHDEECQTSPTVHQNNRVKHSDLTHVISKHRLYQTRKKKRSYGGSVSKVTSSRAACHYPRLARATHRTSAVVVC